MWLCCFRGRIWWRTLGVAAILVAVGVVGGAWWLNRQAEVPPSRPLRLVISGDTAGWIVPCGCTTNQSGGLLRRGTVIKRVREHAEVIVADVGGAPAGTSAYHRLKFEAILKGEMAMGLAAHNVGGPEAALGIDFLRHVSGELAVPLVSANVRDATGQLAFPALRIVDRSGRRVAFAGVLSRLFAGPGVRIDEPRDALLNAIAGQRAKFDALVVLAYLPEDELTQLAAALPEADVVVGGPTGQSIAPRSVGPVLLASATNKGKFLIDLEAPPVGGRPRWTGQVMELGPDIPDDPDQRENLTRYLVELGRQDFAATDTGLVPALSSGLPPDYRLAGTQKCALCHKEDGTCWEHSGHHHAWKTLASQGSQVDPYCQQCHTTGFGLPGGFVSARRSPFLVGVGCESCHGPSLAHSRDPEIRTPFAARDQCERCHDHENSPRFNYGDYWPRIRHGMVASKQRSAQKELSP